MCKRKYIKEKKKQKHIHLKENHTIYFNNDKINGIIHTGITIIDTVYSFCFEICAHKFV